MYYSNYYLIIWLYKIVIIRVYFVHDALSNILYYLPTSKYSDIIMNTSKNLDTNTHNIIFVTSNSWDGTITETNHISTISNILYTSYNMWLFLVSIILLIVYFSIFNKRTKYGSYCFYS
jgi:hypothetical protein